MDKIAEQRQGAISTPLPESTSPPNAPEGNAPRTRQFRSRRSVSFDEVHVREYARCLGNNPSTTHGPPISIDWGYEPMKSITVDAYEQVRPSLDRRGVSELQVPSTVREAMLRQHTDCTKQDIADAVKEVRQSRHERQMTVALQEFESYQLVWEGVQRKWARWIKRRPSKLREIELLWEKAAEQPIRSTNKQIVEPDELGVSNGTASTTSIHTNVTAGSGTTRTSGILRSSSSISQVGEVLKDDSSTDAEEEDHQDDNATGKICVVSPKRRNCGNKSPSGSRSHVIVAEDGTTIIDPSTSPISIGAQDSRRFMSSSSNASSGKVIVVQKDKSLDRQKKKGFFGRSVSDTTSDRVRRRGRVGVRRNVAPPTLTGAIVEC